MPAPDATADLFRLVDEFEAASAADPDTDLATFLPPTGDPSRLPALAELVRVDMERRWVGSARRRFADYLRQFPEVWSDPTVRREVLFEEYRLRCRFGEGATAEGYRREYGVDTADWPVIAPSVVVSFPTARADMPPNTPLPLSLLAAPRTQAVNCHLPSPATPVPAFASDSLPNRSVTPDDPADLPRPGTDFLGFRLVEELGRGAFGRVYLARQGDLSERLVALKVSADAAAESRTLARLQHTNIVPVYSTHRVGRFQAVCMPYFGRTTLAQVVKHFADTHHLPSSGRELKSTVNACQPPTSVALPAVETAPLPALPLSPSGPPEGWAYLEGLSYVEAVLWVGSQLAGGLAHAHARGILHRDLKPANVLLTDEGRPMLLDFNLADDAAAGGAERAQVGGTLPYMAPEQLRAFRDLKGRIDARADVYALGVMLFELLAGRHPFPPRKGLPRAMIDAMLADRKAPPRAREWNRAVPPAAEAIVRKCLSADPADRYQSADQLRDDLDRQLAHRPLLYAPNPSVRERVRKWARRHPRLTSTTAVAVAAGVLLAGVGGGAVYAREQAGNDRARAVLADHRVAFADAQLFVDDRHQSVGRLDDGIAKLRVVLDRYGVPDDGSEGWEWAETIRRLTPGERERVRADVGEVFYRMAHLATLRASGATDRAERQAFARRAEMWTASAERYAGDRLPRALLEQRAAVAELSGDPAAAAGLRARAANTRPGSPRDSFLLGLRLAQSGRLRDALPPLKAATRDDPDHYSGWFVRGTTHLDLGQADQAVGCFSACLALRPDFAPAWLNRGKANATLFQWEEAVADYDRVLRLDRDFAEALYQRAEAKLALDDPKGAAADLDRLLATADPPARAFFVRATVRDRLGDAAGAAADRAEGLRRTPVDEEGWLARAGVRLDHPPADGRGVVAGGAFADLGPALDALSDVDRALGLNPASLAGLQFKAHLLGERLHRPAEAMKVLDRAVELNPDHVPTLAGRGVELARAGDRDAALKDAREALLRDTQAPNLYQVGCIYALTSKQRPDDKKEALRLLWAALKTGFGVDLVDTDSDLDALRKDPEFVRLLNAAKQLHAAPSR